MKYNISGKHKQICYSDDYAKTIQTLIFGRMRYNCRDAMGRGYG